MDKIYNDIMKHPEKTHSAISDKGVDERKQLVHRWTHNDSDKDGLLNYEEIEFVYNSWTKKPKAGGSPE